eukprot:CAMPEP_0117432896 /NCGR_PEP_ID=MMETSP0758-20121206/12325_1 /TAXON_ID=63605 /ORGANISM="Percolomonas cosmopolitus, Strain AE-1 (ATCC 50343)" /LENGTH=163 /DNA_ID=CAMNT_0005223153 /DNA_START=396 /DNA_END=887 /DNA_ORIENTATION=+
MELSSQVLTLSQQTQDQRNEADKIANALQQQLQAQNTTIASLKDQIETFKDQIESLKKKSDLSVVVPNHIKEGVEDNTIDEELNNEDGDITPISVVSEAEIDMSETIHALNDKLKSKGETQDTPRRVQFNLTTQPSSPMPFEMYGDEDHEEQEGELDHNPPIP